MTEFIGGGVRTRLDRKDFRIVNDGSRSGPAVGASSSLEQLG